MTMTISLVSAAPGNLYYKFREPKIKSDKPPVIILMHGYGSKEEDLFSFADQLPDQYLVISLRAPIAMGRGSYAWYPLNIANGKTSIDNVQAEKSRLMVIDFIKNLKNKHQFDDKQIYLGGFSQGGIMSYSVAFSTPDLVKGIFVLSGRLLEETKAQLGDINKIKQLKIFISHGTQDTVLPVSNAREVNTWLSMQGIKAVYKEYTSDHTITTAMFADLLNWFSSK